MSERYVIEIEERLQYVEGEGLNLKPFVVARVYKMTPAQSWPGKRQKPEVSLGAPEVTFESAADQLRRWFMDGALNQQALEARIAAQGEDGYAIG